jgi:hypothetical protein
MGMGTFKEITLNSVCIECGVKNTFGTFVYSGEYTFPILLAYTEQQLKKDSFTHPYFYTY